MPGYPGIRLALPRPAMIAELIEQAGPDAIHIATEGPIGMSVRRYCRTRGVAVSSSFHTRFPEYVSARLPIPEAWSWAALRWFHSLSGSVMAATPPLAQELSARGFGNVRIWPRGVDANLFRPRTIELGYPRPIFLSVGRLAVEKNLEAFLDLDLPGTKVVVGDGPQRASLQRRYRDAVFVGEQFGEQLAETYSAADVFVFPSRTDTYGLVLLEALASGVPVAAFPVTGPRDVIGSAPVGALDDDLRAACLAALTLSRNGCRAFALERSWEASAQAFLANIRSAARNPLSDLELAAEPHASA
jgi:glycosyltransferase involved in cell wall biosynthesis